MARSQSEPPAAAGAGRVRLAGWLRPFVASYVDFDMAGWPPGCHRGLPDRTLELVVSVGPPPAVRCAGHSDLREAATIAGLRSSPVDIIHNGTQRGVQLGLTPQGARALLGLPAAELAHGVWALQDVAGRRADELTERLASARGPARRARVVQTILAGWVVDGGYPAVVDAFWRRLTATGGCVPVTSLADEIGFSRRHMSQLVRAELGLAPKMAARVLRFGRARSCLRTGLAGGLAETAAMCGYFDQAHLTNDWKQLGGCTPGEWMSQELPFLQDHSPARGRG